MIEKLVLPGISSGIAALAIALPALVVTAGQATMTRAVFRAIFRQPALQEQIMRLFLIGLALTETIALIACGMVALLITAPQGPYTALIHICAIVAILLPALLQGWRMSQAGVSLVQSIARQPERPHDSLSLFIITQSLGQTPLIFNTLCAVTVMYQAARVTNFYDAIQLASVALIAGFGSLGTCLGLSTMSQAVGKAYGWRPGMYGHLFSLTLVSMALLETPFLLALGVGLVLFQYPITSPISIITALIVPIMIGITNTIVCSAASRVCSTAALNCAQYPLRTETIIRWSLLAQTFIDTSALYGLMIALLMIMVT
jgi:F0F1-type ATP synthase membrane subunit c/vacuolar-type H+-ATPase subunit K